MFSNSSHHLSNLLAKAACVLALALALTCVARAQTSSGPRLEDTAWAAGTYVFEFRSGGHLRVTSLYSAPSEGTWKLDGDSVLVRLKRSATRYRGVIRGALMTGESRDKSGRVSEWEARRQEATPVRPAAVPPDYPPIAKAARAQGSVMVEVKVDSAGRVSSASVMSGHPLLQQSVLAAAKRWEFNPDTSAGTRVARLFFIFQMVPTDCRKRPPAPAPEFLSNYQVKVLAPEGCINYSVGR